MKNQPDSILPAIKTLSSFTDEEAFSLILNNLQDTFILVDRDLKIITVTEQSKIKIKQYFNVEMFAGISVLDLAKKDRIPFIRDLCNDILTGGQERTVESEVSNIGENIILKTNFKAAKNEKGEIVGVIITSREITAERIAAQNLKKAEERWRFALEGAQQGVWDWNLETGECFYSEGYKKLYGYKPHELNNLISEWESLIHPEDREAMKKAIAEHLAGPGLFHESTYRIITKDGKLKWILARGMIIEHNQEGKPIRMIGTHTDITEQVVSRESIRFSEQNYKNLFQANPLPCWIYDAETYNFLEVNEAAVRHYGISKEEFLTLNVYNIHSGDFFEELDKRLIRESNTPSLSINNWKHVKKNGEEKYVDLSINSIQYNNRNAKLVVINDVTSRVELQRAQKISEEQLRKSNERFELASMATSDAIYDWDLLKNEIFWGEGMQTLFGFAPQEVTITMWEDLLHPEDRPHIIESLSRALINQTKWQHNYRFADAWGNYRYVLDRGFISRDENGNTIRMIGSLQDITDLKQKESELLASNERYNYVTQATSDIIWDWDIINKKVLWSDNYQKIMGWPLPENNTFDLELGTSLIHPDDRENITKKVSETISNPNKDYWQGKFRYLKSDGSYCHVYDRGYIIRNENKEAIRVIGAMQDITERNYYEQLVSLERQVFQMSTNLNIPLQQLTDTLLKGIENIHPGSFTSVILLNEDIVEPLSAPTLPAAFTDSVRGLKLSRVNAAAQGNTLFTTNPVFANDIDNDPLWKDYKYLTAAFGFKACWSLPIIHSSGKIMAWFSMYFKEIKKPSDIELDTLHRVSNIVRILMEHFWSIEEIKKVNQRFDIMMKATHDLVWDWDLKKNIIYRDSIGLQNVYGMDDNKSVETLHAWTQRIHPADQKRFEKIISEILKSKVQNTFDIEYRFLRDDGTYSHVYDRGMLLRDHEGNPERMIGAAQDITVRKKLEQELLQNELERQKAINQATVDTQEQERSEIGKELHDNVNQVLTTTKLYLDLALSNSELKDDLISKSTKNIISVINEIRQLSRSLMDPSIGDLGLIDSINDLIENINLTRKLHVNLTADKHIEALLTNNHRLTVFRIIQEALNNAIKHAKASVVNITISKNKDLATVIIDDNGIGFDPELVKKGAGLKNIQNRIYLINGTHHISSKQDKGCKITISFPLNKNQ